MSSPIQEQTAENTYLSYDNAIASLGLDHVSEELVRKVVREFAASDPPLFEKSKPVFDFLINFVINNKADIAIQNESLRMKFTYGLFEVLDISAPEILNVYETLVQNNFDWKSIDLSKINRDETDLLLNALNVPYLTKKDFLLGIVNSRLDGVINDFVAVKLAGGIISFLGLLNMKLGLTKK